MNANLKNAALVIAGASLWLVVIYWAYLAV